MRRSDREVKSQEDILDILTKCDVIRLGLHREGYPYVVAMNFGIEEKIWPPAIWLHCAKEGLKLDLIRKNPNVGFEADCSHKLITSEDASRFTMEYESIAGFGEISICDGADSKIKGLKSILKHYAPEKEFDIPNQALQAVCILRLDILQISGKRLKV